MLLICLSVFLGNYDRNGPSASGKAGKWIVSSTHISYKGKQKINMENVQYLCRPFMYGYRIELYDKAGVKVFSLEYPHKPLMYEVEDDILEVRMGCDFPRSYTIYFDMQEIQVSETYFNALFLGNRRIACMEAVEPEKLFIEDIFDKNIFYCEVERNFTRTANPGSAIIDIRTMDDGKIYLEYYKGDDYTVVSEVIVVDGEENETVTEELCISDYEWDLARWRKDVEDGREEGYGRYICEEVSDGFEVKLYGREGEEIYSFVYPKEPAINKVTDDVIQISFSTGTESVYLLYFDRKNGKVSDVYYNAIPIGDKYIAYMEDHEKLKIESMFDQQFYAEIERDFSKAAAPGYQIESIGAIDEETIFLRYLRGGEYERTMEIICLSDYMKEKKE